MSLAYEQLRQVGELAAVVLADNPSPMTLDGTNTWLLRDDPARRSAVVVDPGPLDEAHLQAVLAAAGSVPLILLTHGHPDHAEGARRFAELTGAPVYALDPAHRYGGEGLTEGMVLGGAGVRIEVWRTPGHTADSLCFLLPPTGSHRVVLTGDTILGRGTTVVAHPDGVLADYLASLRRLATLAGVTVLPGHGPELPDAGAAASQYLAHREQRLDQVRAVLAELPDASPEQVVERVYAEVDRALWPAAELSVRAQLAYLRQP
ncbi:MAG TPA: MBL fold metallo-hydrolase [Jatrophihabitans sp.]|nr:MBL fold metallo-hydrolase [Jatrophihabitans sp.]